MRVDTPLDNPYFPLMTDLKIILANPRGFCAGVDRAIEIVDTALEIHGAPVYVRHEIVHNKHVVERLRARGAVFVKELDEIPDGSLTIFSAHGVSEAVESEAKRRHLPYIDATCPLVTKVHKQGIAQASKGREVIMVGHDGHPEVEGTRGRIPGGAKLVADTTDIDALDIQDPSNLAFVTQTTLSVDDTREVIEALKERYPDIQGPDLKDICYATQNRQQAVRELVAQVDLLLVIGGQHSSNSNRLRELGNEVNVPAYLIDDASELDETWLEGVSTLGVSAGASAPEELVQELLDRLSELRNATIETLDGIKENMHFKLPKDLEETARSAS